MTPDEELEKIHVLLDEMGLARHGLSAFERFEGYMDLILAKERLLPDVQETASSIVETFLKIVGLPLGSNVIPIPREILSDVLRIAQAHHEPDDCRCEAEILDPIRKLLGPTAPLKPLKIRGGRRYHHA